MPSRTRPGRAAALLLSAVIVAGGLTGCSLLSPFTTCEGTEALMQELNSLPLLDSPPPGATPPKLSEAGYSECADDSGDAYLTAGRTYVYAGTRQEVLDHFHKAAEADGWRYEPNPIPEMRQFGSCFTRGGDGEAKELRISIVKPDEITEFYGPDAATEFATGAGFDIWVGADVEGARTSCWGP
ncbi:hypothetical protein OG625_25105 [Streptomyces sp. NBC_01351]|uniref:hypothetical protein n=1 Tax=Streptomyces sp. NBC_01351 TaxID=2903833 RepID=UPI002E2FFDAA|nr:hypothetical protein [Streptomyces sp. NBC_01351]